MMRLTSLVGLVALAVAFVGLPGQARQGRANTPGTPDLGEHKDRQKQLKAETERLVRRVQTMLQVMEYNRVDAGQQKEMLEEMAKTLSGLSRDQMTRLIASLEAARKAKP